MFVWVAGASWLLTIGWLILRGIRELWLSGQSIWWSYALSNTLGQIFFLVDPLSLQYYLDKFPQINRRAEMEVI